MTGTTVYRVTPADDAWKIELAGDSITEYAPTRSQAVARARELAARAPIGRVEVLDHQGRVLEEHEVAPRRE